MMFLFLFLTGLAIGSFVNCVVYRLNNNLSFLKGRSLCPNCKHKLSWKDNIPLLSFFLLKAHCRYCHSPISWQYPVVELSTAILTVITFVLTINKISNDELVISNLIFNLLFVYTLITIFVSDLIYQIIPDEAIVFGIILTIIFSANIGLLSGLGASAFFLILYLVTRGRGMGLGDVKFVFLMGLLLGWPKIFIALFMAFLTGALVGVILILGGKKRFGQHIAFGPFLVIATWVAYFWGEKIVAWYLGSLL